MSQDNKRIVRRYFEELDRRRETPVACVLPASRFTSPDFPPMNLEAATRFAAISFSGLPWCHVALFLPFDCTKAQQTAARDGTTRRLRIGGFWKG
jgi:hypothetical protein